MLIKVEVILSDMGGYSSKSGRQPLVKLRYMDS